MNIPKVSIIVPVYKTQDTLERCIDSLIMQTLTDLEIILVDDGSPDSSGDLCDKLAIKDARIKVIHKENGGLSSARNVAMDIACGEYIGFVDSDDYVDVAMFEKLYYQSINTQSDICLCGYTTVINKKFTDHYLTFSKEIYVGTEIHRNFIVPLIGVSRFGSIDSLDGFVWRNLYKNSFIKNLRFESERKYFAEDVVFNLNAYKKASRISVVNECLLYYEYNPISLTNKYREGIWDMLCNLIDKKQTLIIELNLHKEAQQRLYNEILKFVIFSLKNSKKKEPPFSHKESSQKVKAILTSPYVEKAIKNIEKHRLNKKLHVLLILIKIKFYRAIYYLI